MVKLKDSTEYHDGVKNYGFKEKTVKKAKLKTDYDDFGSTNKLLTAGGIKSKRKWKKAIRKAPKYVHHDNIYDLDEVDSKFEGTFVFF